MCFSPDGAAAEFYRALVSKSDFDVKTLIGSVDLNLATASVPADRAMIMQEIENTIGVDAFNKQVQRFLEAALKSVAASFLLARSTRTHAQSESESSVTQGGGSPLFTSNKHSETNRETRGGDRRNPNNGKE